MAQDNKRLYVGVDVGGTKILAVLSTARGEILARQRRPTPREGGAAKTVAAIVQTIADLLEQDASWRRSLGAIGLAVPGVVGEGQDEVTFAPNLRIAGINLVSPLKKKFGVRAVLGNDVNVGTLGEKWLGAARDARSAVGIFVGTGIGGGIIQDGKLLTGRYGSAGEIGHMIMQIGGPRCGCGGLGCLEALASRTAIERDLRRAMRDGKKTVLTKLAGPKPVVIKSSVLATALAKKDKLVMDVIGRASEVLGEACLTIRHVLDPQVIVLGGGVVEACGAFMVPIVRRIVAQDKLLAKISTGKVAPSELGDDAVALGAVALAQQSIGKDPFTLAPPRLRYPKISRLSRGQAIVGGKSYREDVYIRADGKVKKRRKLLEKVDGQAGTISAAEMERICKGRPKALLVVSAGERPLRLAAQAKAFLRQHNIELHHATAANAAKAYDAIKVPKAAWIHVGG